MKNKTVHGDLHNYESVMNKIDDCVKRNAIRDLANLAYNLVQELIKQDKEKGGNSE